MRYIIDTHIRSLELDGGRVECVVGDKKVDKVSEL